jgi:hypothetical protein
MNLVGGMFVPLSRAARESAADDARKSSGHIRIAPPTPGISGRDGL